MTFDPGVAITRDLIAANPDAALEHIHQLALASQQSSVMINDLQGRLAEAEGTRHELENRLEQQADQQAQAAAHGEEISRLTTELADSNAQRSSLLQGQADALAAYRELVMQQNPALPPSLVSGGTLHDLNTSIQAARDIVAHVQSQIPSPTANGRMPSGAPMRSTAPDPTQMSRTEKLLYGVRQARGEEMATG